MPSIILFILYLQWTGEQIEEGDDICGLRIVDQSKKGKPAYKLELWLKSTDDSVAHRIRAKLHEILRNGNNAKPPDFDYSKRN